MNKCSYSIKYDIRDIPTTGIFCFDCSFSLIRKIIKCNVYSINDTFIRLWSFLLNAFVFYFFNNIIFIYIVYYLYLYYSIITIYKYKLGKKLF